MMTLMKGADSVELKLTIPAPDHRATIGGLKIDALDAQIRQVFFLDTPDQRLSSSGVILRARRVQGKRGDSTVKLRPVVPSELPGALAQDARLRRRSRRDARRVRLLCVAEEPRRQRGWRGTRHGQPTDSQTVLEGPARVLPDARTGRHCPGRSTRRWGRSSCSR